MISTRQQTNLVKTTIFMLRDTTVKFNMNTYFCDESSFVPDTEMYVCGTSCCLAGYGPLALNNGAGQRWGDYIDTTFSGGKDDVWNFLFDTEWPNDREEAAARVLAFLRDQAEGGGLLTEWSEASYLDYDLRFYTGESTSVLIEQLEKFIVE